MQSFLQLLISEFFKEFIIIFLIFLNLIYLYIDIFAFKLFFIEYYYKFRNITLILTFFQYFQY